MSKSPEKEILDRNMNMVIENQKLKSMPPIMSKSSTQERFKEKFPNLKFRGNPTSAIIAFVEEEKQLVREEIKEKIEERIEKLRKIENKMQDSNESTTTVRAEIGQLQFILSLT